MTTIDLSPLYRNSIGFDRLASLLDGAYRTEQTNTAYPPYNIEVTDENNYNISLAVAGFTQNDIDIEIEGGVLTIKGKKETSAKQRNYLHQGIANRAFQRKFNLAEHVEVIDAKLNKGLLSLKLVREIPEAMKSRRIKINTDAKMSEQQQTSIHAA